MLSYKKLDVYQCAIKFLAVVAKILSKLPRGYAFLAEKLQDLEAIYGRIAVELQSQYLLTYYSPDAKADGSFRRISVRVPGRPELRIRSRQGYYPTRSPSRH